MLYSRKTFTVTKWTARILSSLILIIGLPFYFGYGNPLPFMNPEYSFFDNMWLIIFPIMFTGLVLGWKFEKTGGWVITASVSFGLIVGLILQQGMIYHMLIPLIPGVLYIVAGSMKKQLRLF